MNPAHKHCYPFRFRDAHGRQIDISRGLTFRERLIIALVGNPELIVTEQKIADKNMIHTSVDHTKTAKIILLQAEAIIKEMQNE